MDELLTRAQPRALPARARPRVRGWIAYACAWGAAAVLWSIASATSSPEVPGEQRLTVLQALPYAALAMGTAAILGVGIWHLTGRVRWSPRGPSFYASHAAGLACFVILYPTSMVMPDLARGDVTAAVKGVVDSPVIGWNVLIACWLYLMVAGISYAIRSDRERQREADAAAEARLLAQRAQLSAIRAQLNPHFLFNALHTVGALVTHDPAAADRAIDRLGDLLRYAMADEEMVPLAAEWKFLRDYLAFEQLRLGERLHIVDRLDARAADCLVPALILQPLVENAVRHGISTRPAGGTVFADAKLDGDELFVRIADDGSGNGAPARGDGLGLASVRRRIDATYGGRGSMHIDTASGYAVTLRMVAE
jgi:LytS/YehU family sensor histidine kinase